MTVSQIFINENPLVVQWLELWAFTAKGTGSIHDWEIRFCKPWHNQKKKKKERKEIKKTKKLFQMVTYLLLKCFLRNKPS